MKRRLDDRKKKHKQSRRVVKHRPLRITLFQLDTMKWDHFEILGTGRSDIHYRIKESLLIEDLKPSLNETVGSEKFFLYKPFLGLFIISFPLLS